jgi:long-chain acyl-CoA synthetase
MSEADTGPKLLLQSYQKYGDKKVALRKKHFGIWQVYTWKDYYEHVKNFGLGLVSLGLEREDKVAIIGDNEPEWYFADIGAQSVGGIVVGVYTDSSAPEVKYLVEHSDSKFVVAKDQEQVDKMLAIKGELPLLQKVIYWDPRGLWDYEDPLLVSFSEIEEMGRKYEEAHPGAFEQMVEQGKGEDVSLLMYTSGTTGVQKGALITHNSLIVTTQMSELGTQFNESDAAFSFLPPAWMADHYYNIIPQLMRGFTVNFPEEPETIQENLREIGPQVLLFGSRQWEMTVSAIQTRIDASSALNRFMFNRFLSVGYRVVDARFSKRAISPLWKILYKLGDLLVFASLRDKHGFSKVRIPNSGGGMLSYDIIRFFYTIGVPIKNGYGASETGGVGVPYGDELKLLESVGKVPPQIEAKITDEGEIVCRGPSIFAGYYKDPEATQMALRDGWFHTGDAGYIDEDGYVYFWDRLKDISELAGGVKFAPQYVESRLKFSPYINNVMTIGDEETPYVTAIININFDTVSKWAERHHINFTTYVDLSTKPEVYDLVQKDVERVNASLPEAAQIKKFVLLHKEFDPDEAELTRSRKLRRRFMRERYKELLDAMYSDKEDVTVEAQVTYRDGRTGTISTNLKIKSLEKVTGK